MDRLLAREASGENPEFKVMRVSPHISSFKTRIQSSEFAAGLGGQEKQPKSRVQSCGPPLREFEGEKMRIENSESTARRTRGRDIKEFKVQSLKIF